MTVSKEEYFKRRRRADPKNIDADGWFTIPEDPTTKAPREFGCIITQMTITSFSELNA